MLDEADELAQVEDAAAARAFSVMVRDEYALVHGRNHDDDAPALAALEEAEHSGDTSVLVSLLAHTGQRAEWRGEYERAIRYARRSVEVASRANILSDALFGQWFLGIAYTATGEYGRGFDVLSEGLALSERIGDRAVRARLLNTLGWFYAEIGCDARAAEFNRMATDQAREMVDLELVAGAPELYANASINLAGNLTAFGDLSAAFDQLAPIQEQLDSSADPWMRWRYSLNLLHGQARIELARGEPERALHLASSAVAGARERSARKIEARGLELRARALLSMDHRDAAESTLEDAIHLARAIQHPPVIWRALSLAGELARRRGHRDIADLRISEARECIEQRARTLEDSGLRSEFLGLAERIAADPMSDH